MERLLLLLSLIAVISGIFFPIIAGLIAFRIFTFQYPWEYLKKDKWQVRCVHLIVLCILCIFIPRDFLSALPIEIRTAFILPPHLVGAIAAWWLYRKMNTT